MSLHTVKVLEINITNSSKKEILELLKKYCESGVRKTAKTLIIVTPNPEQIVYAETDAHFVDFLNQADVAIPDGVGVVWASRVLSSSPVSNVIPGVEFMEDVIDMSSKRGYPVALIGGRQGVAIKAFECLRQKYPRLRGLAMDAPQLYIGPSGLSGDIDKAYFDRLAKKLVEKGVRVVFVGLGSPKQEYFIEKLASQDTLLRTQESVLPLVFMSVGGAFDEIAGRLVRPPQWVNSFGLKWLWRLILEPWRIKRQLALMTFVYLVLRKRYTLK